MGRLSAQDQAALDRLLALRDAPDEPVEVWIRDGNREYKVTGSNAEKVLRRLGIIDDEDQGDGDPGTGTPPPAKKTAKKAVPAKKAAGPPHVPDEDHDEDEDEDEGDEDQGDEGDPPQSRRHFVLG